jgi:hypothetical protein
MVNDMTSALTALTVLISSAAAAIQGSKGAELFS